MSPQTRPDETATMTRRAVLGLAAAAAAGPVLSGCAAHDPSTVTKTPAATAVRNLAPDVTVAVEAAAMLRGAEAAVTRTGQTHPRLATRLAGLLAAHRAHLAAVVDAVPDRVDVSAGAGGGAAYVVPGRPAPALRSLVVAEHTLHDGLIALAMRAESGAFARLLGSMAASVSQQLRVLAG